MPTSTVRQTALSGPLQPVDGWPSLFDFAGVPSGYVPVTHNVSAAHPLIVTAAQGFAATGPKDRLGSSATNLTWPAVPQDGAFHLYVDVASNGTLTPGFTVLPPIYQESGTPSVAAGQHTYNILEATMYVGDGSTAKAVWRVFLGFGWAASAKGRITALRPFAYQGRWTTGLRPFPAPVGFDRLEDTFIPGALLTARWVGVCTAPDGNYWTGNELPASSFDGYFTEVIDATGYVRVDTAAAPAQIRNGTDGARVDLDPTHWRLKCYLARSW